MNSRAIGKKSVFAITNVIEGMGISFCQSIYSPLRCGSVHGAFHKYCVYAGAPYHDRYGDDRQFLYTINHRRATVILHSPCR